MGIGIFGGTFDPVHHGHLITAFSVLNERVLKKIIFIPANISPHKTGKKSTPGYHRLEMLKLAVNKIDSLEVSDIELKKEGVSYTVDTIKELKNIYDKIELIIGEDNLAVFDKWKDPDEIVRICDLIVLKRKFNQSDFKENKYYHRAIFVETPIIEISASGIRKLISEDKPINFLVPEKIREYIYLNNLYKEDV